MATAGEVAFGELEGLGVEKGAGGGELGDDRVAVFDIGDFGGWSGGRSAEEGEKEEENRWRREEWRNARRGTCHGILGRREQRSRSNGAVEMLNRAPISLDT